MVVGPGIVWREFLAEWWRRAEKRRRIVLPAGWREAEVVGRFRATDAGS